MVHIAERDEWAVDRRGVCRGQGNVGDTGRGPRPLDPWAQRGRLLSEYKREHLRELRDNGRVRRGPSRIGPESVQSLQYQRAGGSVGGRNQPRDALFQRGEHGHVLQQPGYWQRWEWQYVRWGGRRSHHLQQRADGCATDHGMAILAGEVQPAERGFAHADSHSDCHADSITHANTLSDANSDPHVVADTDALADAYSESDTYPNSLADAHSHADGWRSDVRRQWHVHGACRCHIGSGSRRGGRWWRLIRRGRRRRRHL